MKFLLTLIMCSYVDQVCLPPHPWPTQFDDAYDCMMVGYDEAKAKLEEIGREGVNTHQIYIRFVCAPVETI